MLPPVSFRIVSRWQVTGRIADVARLLTTPEDFPRWWGAVYLKVTILRPGDERGVGQTVAVHSKGWLPYRLHWQGTLIENQAPGRWRVAATGDLVGEGIWTLTEAGGRTEVTYDWRVTSDRLLFRLLAPLLKGLMISNHNWAMKQGETGLQAELDRLRAHTPTILQTG